MANEPTRLTTADLRRRLHTGPAAAPMTFPDDPAHQMAPAGRFSGGSRYGDQIDSEAVNLAYEAAQAAEMHPTPVPARRSSRLLQRPMLPTASNVSMPTPHSDPMMHLPQAGYDHGVVEQLQAENQQLNALLEEMRQLLQDASEQQDHLQTELSAVTEAYTAAQTRVVALEEIVNTKPKTRDELEEWSDELERENSQLNQQKKLLNEDRRQLQDDEMSLEKQMRQMEVGMARERAMLARQETELKRLSAELQREIEGIQRGDAGLRDRMAVFQRRHAEAMGVATGGHPAGASHAGYGPGLPTAPAVTGPSAPTPTPRKNDTTGLLRKIFRSGE